MMRAQATARAAAGDARPNLYQLLVGYSALYGRCLHATRLKRVKQVSRASTQFSQIYNLRIIFQCENNSVKETIPNLGTRSLTFLCQICQN